MSFLNTLRSTPLPPVKNLLNVAMQTARQQMPGHKGEYEQPQGSEMAGEQPAVPPRPHNVHFAEPEGKYHPTVFLDLEMTLSLLVQVPHFPPKPTS